MMITLSRLYPDGATAHAVVEELKAVGLPEDDIGLIAPSYSLAYSPTRPRTDVTSEERAGRVGLYARL